MGEEEDLELTKPECMEIRSQLNKTRKILRKVIESLDSEIMFKDD
jgi:hypothetical protein